MITGIGLQIDEMAQQGQFTRRQKTTRLIGDDSKLILWEKRKERE